MAFQATARCDRCGASLPHELPSTLGDKLMQTICLGCAYRGSPQLSRSG